MTDPHNATKRVAKSRWNREEVRTLGRGYPDTGFHIVEKRTIRAPDSLSFDTYTVKFKETQNREIRRENLGEDQREEDRRELDNDVVLPP